MTNMIGSTDGVRVALHDLGGNGPPLLFLHATGFHGRCYRAVAEHLHDDFHVWAPDLRGHGEAETPDIALPWSGMVDDALAVIDHLGITDPVVACGHSMGGSTVLGVELRRPTTIQKAWLFEPIVFPPPELGGMATRENPMAAVARKRRHDFDSYEHVIEHYRGRGPFTNLDDGVLADYVHHGFRATDSGVTLRTTGEMEARTFEGIDMGVYSHLGEVDTPVTVVQSGDGQNPAQAAPIVADQLPNATLHVWPDRSHFGPFEDPARAAADIRKALT